MSILGAGPEKTSNGKITFENSLNASFSFLERQNSLYWIVDVTTFSVQASNVRLSQL
jgi:hypothetical protein